MASMLKGNGVDAIDGAFPTLCDLWMGWWWWCAGTKDCGGAWCAENSDFGGAEEADISSVDCGGKGYGQIDAGGCWSDFIVGSGGRGYRNPTSI